MIESRMVGEIFKYWGVGKYRLGLEVASGCETYCQYQEK